MLTSHFNDELYRKIRDARKECGLPISNMSEDIVNHEMTGKKLYSKVDRKVYTVQAVYKQFLSGFYEMFMLVDENGSLRPSPIKNISSINSVILNSIVKNKENFTYE